MWIHFFVIIIASTLTRLALRVRRDTGEATRPQVKGKKKRYMKLFVKLFICTGWSA